MAGIKELQEQPESLAGEPAEKSRQPHPYFTQELKDQLFPPLENMRVPPKERREIRMAEEDLGSMMPLGSAQPTGGEPLPVKGSSQPRSWAQMVSDPVMAAGLFAAGTAMMRGGYGTMGQQVGQALSEGGAAAGSTAGHMLENQRYEQKQADTKSEHALERANKKDIANIGAESRSEVANIRVQGMLDRAAMIHGPQSDKEMKLYGDQHKAFMTKAMTETGNPISPYYKMNNEQLKTLADAHAKSVLQDARMASGVRSQGAPLESSGQGASQAATSGSAGQSPPPGQAGATTQDALKTESSTPNLDKMIADPRFGPKLKEELATPEGRQRLLNSPDVAIGLRKEIRDKYGIYKDIGIPKGQDY